jgi:hypothetical protein
MRSSRIISRFKEKDSCTKWCIKIFSSKLSMSRSNHINRLLTAVSRLIRKPLILRNFFKTSMISFIF